jgi:FtsP/CotA-like multicopper oxidase with cupredoxin domain
MNVLKTGLVVVIIGVATLNFGAECPTTNLISDPEIFQWTHHPGDGNNPEEYFSGVLEYGAVTLMVGGESFTTRAYRQEGSAYSIPGPTMVMEPGKKYVLRYRNLLPYEAPSSDVNVFKDPNISNLHTHGLHISGESPGDDVTRFFEGGFGGDFVYDIPLDHMGGTFWYHAHHHGSTFLQVSGGAFGLIIIDDSLDNIPQTVADMEEKHLVVGFVDPNVAGTGGDTLIGGGLSPTWTVNGMVNGNLCMPPDTWQHWRVLVADRDARDKTVAVGSQCEVALMARDGVWRTEVPLNLSSNSVTITGASRADLAVRCSGDSDITLDGEVVANVFVNGSADPSVHPYDTNIGTTWLSQRPAYLRDLRNLSPSNSETVSMGARTINGNKFDHHEPTFVLPADGMQEWTVKGARQHPFHLHIYHVQMNGNCGNYENGEYYDVIATNCDVRFDLNAATSTVYEGRTIMHCHILAHEDQGAMGWADIIGGIAAPTYPVDGNLGFAYQEYYSLGGGGEPPQGPSSLNAVTASSSQIDLSWADNSTDEDGFEIERSTDGSTFSFLTTVAAESTSYSDTGLAASTEYWYRLFAYNQYGDSGYSNTASATTGSVSAGASVDVGSITLSTVNQGRGLKAGRAVVTVTDDQGSSVENATVSGYFSGTFNDVIAASTPTDSGGSTTIDTSGSAKGSITLTFCVTGITHDTLDDFPSTPGEEICGSL